MCVCVCVGDTVCCVSVFCVCVCVCVWVGDIVCCVSVFCVLFVVILCVV